MTSDHVRAGVVALLGLLSACATHKSYSPDLNAPARTGLEPDTAILVGVIDGRTGVSNRSFADSLLADLTDIYGSAVERHDYFAEVPTGRVGVKIRIRRLSSEFGSRVISTSALRQRQTETSVNATSRWGYLVGEAETRSNTLSSSMIAEGWWIGGAWLDLEVADRREGSRETVQFALVEEVRKSNTMGYQTAENATKEAWRAVSSDLLYVFDKIAKQIIGDR